MTKTTASTPFVLSREAVPPEAAEAVMAGAAVAEAAVATLEVSGPGVIQCLQGLLTNDLEAAGDDGFLYGAVLTNKGTIVSDMWTALGTGPTWLSVPVQGKDALLDVFARFLPPRLAKVTDHSDNLTVLRITGPHAIRIAKESGIPTPEPGTSAPAVVGDAACLVSRPTEPADFALQIQLARERVPSVQHRITEAGGVSAGPDALEFARILAGWPRLSAEIDDKTLPQEVRFDDINGVSYTKGCYTGQETVARVHFRGHVNKEVRGLVWEEAPNLSETAIVQDDKPAGRVASIAWIGPAELHVGLGMVHRRADVARPVVAAGKPAAIADLPFALPR